MVTHGNEFPEFMNYLDDHAEDDQIQVLRRDTKLFEDRMEAKPIPGGRYKIVCPTGEHHATTDRFGIPLELGPEIHLTHPMGSDQIGDFTITANLFFGRGPALGFSREQALDILGWHPTYLRIKRYIELISSVIDS